MSNGLRVRYAPMQLSRQAIARTAVGILDSYGLADVSMRRVAGALNVAPGALYWHIDSKQALISAMAEEIIAPLLTTTYDDPKLFCSALRSALLDHTDGADVVSTAAAQPDSTVFPALLEAIRTAFDASGDALSDESIDAAATGLLYLTLGAANMHQAGTQLTNATTKDYAVFRGSEEQVNAAIDLLLAGLTGPGR